MYTKVDVLKPGDNKGVGGDKKDKLIIFDWDDVLTMPQRDSKGIVITGNIVFKPNTYQTKLYVTQSTIKAGADSEGDPDAKGITQTVEGSHPGDSVEIREFRANWMNKNIGIIIEKCGTQRKNLYGTPCAPLQMVFKAEDDKDKNNTTFTFKSIQKGPDVADYQGTFTFDAPIATVPAATETINVAAGEGRYQLTSGVAGCRIMGLTGGVEGGVYTLVGSGGAHPPDISTDEGEIILEHGINWVALEGSEITIRAYPIANNTLSYYEQSRK